MLCSEIQLFSQGAGFEDVKPLPCRRWSCEHCRPIRRRRLLALAASGQPNKFLTLTVHASVGSSPVERRNMLHDAWKRLVKRILRQWALEPGGRWVLKTKVRTPSREAIVRSITART